MKRFPLVSVIIPTYNQEQYIDNTLIALLNQTYSNIEFIISDDCSLDGTWQRLLEWEVFLSAKGKVILHQQPCNMGIAENYNWLFKHANGEIIVINEGDDISLEERVERLVQYFNETGPWVMALQSEAEFLTDHGIYPSSLKQSLKYGYKYVESDYRWKKTPIVFDGNSMAFRRELIKKFPLIHPQTPWVDDALGKRALLLGGYVFYPDKLVLYRIHESNTSFEGMGKGKKRLRFLIQNLRDINYAFRNNYIKFHDFTKSMIYILLCMLVTILNTIYLYRLVRNKLFGKKAVK